MKTTKEWALRLSDRANKATEASRRNDTVSNHATAADAHKYAGMAWKGLDDVQVAYHAAACQSHAVRLRGTTFANWI